MRASRASMQISFSLHLNWLGTAGGGGGGGGGSLEQWVQCSKCQKWRRISQKVHDETVASAADAPWFCEWDYERVGASCEQPDDYEAENGVAAG